MSSYLKLEVCFLEALPPLLSFYIKIPEAPSTPDDHGMASLKRDITESMGNQTFHFLPHCTEKTNEPNSPALWEKAFAAMGIELQILASGCCGMSGTLVTRLGM